MTTLRILLAGLLGACGLVVFTAMPSHACSCVVASTDDYVEWADAIFTGTVVEVTPPPQRPVMSSGDPVTHTFDVETVHEGDVASTAEVTSAMSGASCGLEGLRIGTSYLVYAESGHRGLSANLCGGTGPASPARVDGVERVLGTGGPPATAVPDSVVLASLADGLGVFRGWW
ncbi:MULTISPECIES: hypothetical protein [unclassified Nocardioides]|uniref:hypothetical protein n=1 Tax=unclassified Nocardioides TaxID=2615069 RepID=UPI0009F120D2|nr:MULTISPECIES: hypothetical protein [unclassified Nocardioides]GAW51766.1 uncharacterized protein PD653B2_4111 [Nocardioides sp. PD653-B2]GAW55266.1 uncharacterized protein PD653_2691 [Nocardioides sp. PD653]